MKYVDLDSHRKKRQVIADVDDIANSTQGFARIGNIMTRWRYLRHVARSRAVEEEEEQDELYQSNITTTLPYDCKPRHHCCEWVSKNWATRPMTLESWPLYLYLGPSPVYQFASD